MYAERRARLLEAMGGGVAVFPAAPVFLRNNDVEHEYRQDSDLHYLTGFDEPEAVLVLSTVHPDHRAVLFVRKRDPAREVWDGPRAGVDGAVRDFGVDAAFTIDELAEKLPDYLQNAGKLFYRLGRDPQFDAKLLAAIGTVRSRARTGVHPPREIVDPAWTLHEHRLRKQPEELAVMRRASAISREAHAAAMRLARPGRHEFEVDAEIRRTFRARGCERPAYEPIVGSGRNATILHYRRNDRLMQDGDLLLIDAGCELEYYASDVTRTFPVSGRFTPEQRAIYDVVLDAQKRAIDSIVPGVTLDHVHDVAVRALTEGMVRIGLLSGDVDKSIADAAFKPYYMHRTSHWLGMDVHDVGAYYIDGKSRALEPGFVLTVEPGLYVAEDAACDPKWRGIGVRIEDDVLVTLEGHENLTAEIPREPDQIERILAEASRAERDSSEIPTNARGGVS